MDTHYEQGKDTNNQKSHRHFVRRDHHNLDYSRQVQQWWDVTCTCVSIFSLSTPQRRATYGSLYHSSSVLCCFALYSVFFLLYSCFVFVLVTEVASLCLCVVLCHTHVLCISLQQSLQFSAIHLPVLCTMHMFTAEWERWLAYAPQFTSCLCLQSRSSQCG